MTLQIFFDPAGSVFRQQLLLHVTINRLQIAHVVHGVIEFIVRQRAFTPVGAGMLLFQTRTGDLKNQIGITDLMLETEYRSRQLGIENRRGYLTKLLVENFKILAWRVKDFE